MDPDDVAAEFGILKSEVMQAIAHGDLFAEVSIRYDDAADWFAKYKKIRKELPFNHILANHDAKVARNHPKRPQRGEK